MILHRRLSSAIAVSLIAGVMAVTAQPAQAASSTEGFDDISKLAGWQTVNLSSPIGTRTWEQGDQFRFPAHSGAANSYIGIPYSAASTGGNASTWLIAPKLTSLSSTDALSFWTRSGNTSGFPDRLEVRMSTNGSCNPGTTVDGVGDFTTVLGTVNPDLTDTGYPVEWTQYTFAPTSLSTTNVSGCLAFRYVVPDTANNGQYVGLDTVTLTDNASSACTTAQGAQTAAQAQVTTATAEKATAAKKAKKAKKKLKKARKALKKASRSEIEKATKKVKKTKKKAKKAKKKRAAATRALTAAQTALATAQTTSTTSCP